MSDGGLSSEEGRVDSNQAFFTDYRKLNSWSLIDDKRMCYIKKDGVLVKISRADGLTFLSSKFEGIKHISKEEVEKALTKKTPTVSDLLIRSLLDENSGKLKQSSLLRHLLVFKKKGEAGIKHFGLLKNGLEPWEISNKDIEMSPDLTHILFDSANKLTGNVQKNQLDLFIQLFKGLVHNQV